jgi:TATA element modulatory factor
MAFMGHNGEEDGTEASEKPQSPQNLSAVEENHGTPTKKPTPEVDASEVAETAQSPEQASKIEETHTVSTESAVSKVDISEQLSTPQTPTHPPAVEEKGGDSTESPTPMGDASEVAEPSQSPTHPSTTEGENQNGSSETISSIRKEEQHHQDSEHSVPSDETLPIQLGDSGGDTSDGKVPSSPSKLDPSSKVEVLGSIHTGKEDTGDVSQSQAAGSIPGNSDGVNEPEVKIVQESDVQTEVYATQTSSDTVEETTHLDVKVHDGNINTAGNEDESNQMMEGVASVVEREDNTREQIEDLRSKSVNVEHRLNSRNGLEATSEDVPAEQIEVDSTANDLRNEETKQESVRIMNQLNPESVGSVVELDKLRREMKMMEAALQGAARQSQVSFP